jgi:phospholipid-translocating ATPase
MSYRRSLKDWYYQRKWFQHHPQPDGESSIDDEYDEERSTRSLSTTSGHPMRPRRAGTSISLRKGEQFLRRPTNRARLRQIQKGGRRVFVNLPLPKAERNANGTPKQCYASNRIVTSKYTILTFVPKNLFFQFSRLANVYFLGMAILQLLPYFGINSPALTLLPICSVLVISAVKDAFEDYQRHTLDHRYNTQVAYTLAGYRNVNYGTDSPAKKALKLDQSISSLEEVEGKFHPSTSEHVRVGDFLLLRNGDKVPSDCVLLASSDETGICFVETKDLDGETNLKARQAMSDTLQIQSGQECLDLHFYVEAEAPHPNLYHFDGTMVTLGRTDPQDAETTGRTSNANWEERSKLPITIDNMLLRGHVIRNTRWIIANVVFTGVDTKIMLNSGETPTKRSEIEKELNEEASGVTSRSGMSWSKQLIFNVDLSCL